MNDYLPNCSQLTATVNYFLGVGKLDKVRRVRPCSPTDVCRVSWLKCRLWFDLSYECPAVFHCGLESLFGNPLSSFVTQQNRSPLQLKQDLVDATNECVAVYWPGADNLTRLPPDPRSRLVSLLYGSNWNSSEINCGSTRRGSSCSSRRSDNWPNSCWRMARRSECQHPEREAAGWRHFRILFYF